jgi:AcrR family transcriptional regulator
MTGPAKIRSDSRRNHEAILTAAIAVLAGAPRASMSDVAEASGMGRTTLYRHFPDRHALVAAIYDRVFAEAEAITSELLRGSEDPIETLQALGVTLAGLGDRYRFLGQHDAAAPQQDPQTLQRRGEPLHAFLRSAQRAGAINGEVSVDWLFTVLVALITEASRPADAEPQLRDEMLRATVRRLFAP